MDFSVQLGVFRGPLDLLLYLVRKREVEITEVALAQVAEQFLEYLDVIKQLDVNAAGDFLAVAGALLEIKSQQVLPHGDEIEEPLDDPRQDLVPRLLEYKKYRDAAGLLEERGRAWLQHFPRLDGDLPPGETDPADQPIEEVELWDLVSAFGRIIRESDAVKPTSIVYDDTPIHVHMERIRALLNQRGTVVFRELFPLGAHRSTLIGLFLAVLELVRHHYVRVEQEQLFGEIVLRPDARCDAPVDATDIDQYEHA